MPNPDLNEALKEAYASANMRTIDTIEFRHSVFSPIYIAKDYRPSDLDRRNRQKFTATLENGTQVNFICLPFEISMPELDTKAVPEITLAIENVMPLITIPFQSASQSNRNIQVLYRCYIENQTGTPAMGPLKMIMNKVKVTKTTIIAKCRGKIVGDKVFPDKKYKISDFPALV